MLVAAVVLLALTTSGYAQSENGDGAAGVGTVETVAGPGFCEGPSSREESSLGTGAVAVSSTGVVHFDSGRPSEGVVARVDASGVVSKLRTRPRTSPTSELGPTGLPAGAQASGRLAPDPAGGVIVATGRGVLRIATESGERLAGEPQSDDPGPGPASSGDGINALGARFRQIRALATDAQGNVFVADLSDPDTSQVRIRFINRSAAPVKFYPGTAFELTVAPGVIDTVIARDSGPDAQEGGLASRALLAGAGISMAVAGDRLYVGLSSGRGVDAPSSIRMFNLGGSALVAHGASLEPAMTATVAGGRGSGLGGDGGPAREALLSSIGGITIDDRGNLYVADEGNNRIRRVDDAGTITTFAGANAPGTTGGGFNGNDRLASTARLDRPVDVDAGPNNRIYISDRGNAQVRFVDGAGTIRAAPGNGLTLAWNCEGGTAGEPQVPVSGALDGVAADSDGSVYLAVNALDQVKRVDGSGRLTTAVGLGPSATASRCGDGEDCAPATDGSRATLARLSRPGALALRPGMRGGLYIVERGLPRIRFANLSDRAVRVHGVTVLAGTVRTVAGNGSPGLGGDGGRALDAQLAPNPGGLSADDAGNLFIGDTARIRRVDAEGVITSVVSPTPSPTPTPTDFPPCCGKIAGLAAAPGGGLYVADSEAYVVWVANPRPVPITVRGHELAPGAAVPFAGSGQSGFEGDGGPAVEARMVPRGIAAAPDGSVFVGQVVGAPRTLVDQQRRPILDAKGQPRIVGDLSVTIDHSVRKIDTEGIISTVMGGGKSGFNGDGMIGRATNVFVPTAMAADRCGNLLLVDRDNDRLRRLRLVASCEQSASAPLGDRSGGSLLRPWLVVFTLVMVSSTGAIYLRRGRR